jgi:hypothetical protein
MQTPTKTKSSKMEAPASESALQPIETAAR